MVSFPLLLVLLSTSSDSNVRRNRTSPWSPAEWKITLNFGRESGGSGVDAVSAGDDNWGASGARLALTVPVCIQAGNTDTQQQRQQRKRQEEGRSIVEDDFLGERCDPLQVLDSASYITMQGTQQVDFATLGAWRLSGSTRRRVGDASTLRIILGLKNTITRNDVVVSAPQKLYLTTNAWRNDEELRMGQSRMKFVQQQYQDAQSALDDQLSHETGDRRLDGTNLLDVAAATIDMASLVKQRDDRWSDVRQAQMTLPYKELSPPGAWPGSDQSLVIQEGIIAVRRKKKGGFFGTEELAVVGRWTASPMEILLEKDDDEDEDEGDDYDYDDDDEEEEDDDETLDDNEYDDEDDESDHENGVYEDPDQRR